MTAEYRYGVGAWCRDCDTEKPLRQAFCETCAGKCEGDVIIEEQIERVPRRLLAPSTWRGYVVIARRTKPEPPDGMPAVEALKRAITLMIDPRKDPIGNLIGIRALARAEEAGI